MMMMKEMFLPRKEAMGFGCGRFFAFVEMSQIFVPVLIEAPPPHSTEGYW